MSLVSKKVGGQVGRKKAALDPKLTGLVIECPKTKQRFASGIGTDAENLRTTWRTVGRAECPYCGGVHAFSVREAYIKATLMATGLGTGQVWRLAPLILLGEIMKKTKRKKSTTAKAVRSAKGALRKTGAGIKRVAKKAARATGMAWCLSQVTSRPGPHLVLVVLAR
jgi:hypothetical protein